MASLDDTLLRNLGEAYATSDAFAAASGLDLWDVRDVMTTMLVTESGGGYIYGNDGQGYREPSEGHTPWNWNSATGQPIGTPSSRAAMRELLRRSVDPVWLEKNDLRMDKVGSNGRSTGPAQQLSEETGGAWGPMAGTMRMSTSMQMFLDAVDWSNRSSVYKGLQMANWQTAMLLRVQQPLASEVAANYGASQLAAAQAIDRDPRLAPGTIAPAQGELDAASTSEINDAVVKGFVQ